MDKSHLKQNLVSKSPKKSTISKSKNANLAPKKQHLSSQNYKQIAISRLKARDYDEAMLYLSLAYEQKPSKALLNLIELCQYSLKAPAEGDLMVDFYLKHAKNRSVSGELGHIVEFSEISKAYQIGSGEALSWTDFLQSEREIGFKQSFENVIGANKLVISSRKDFLCFLEKLAKHGYTDTALNYIEMVCEHFAGDVRFIKLQEKLRQKP